jgi:hypothetical protein
MCWFKFFFSEKPKPSHITHHCLYTIKLRKFIMRVCDADKVLESERVLDDSMRCISPFNVSIIDGSITLSQKGCVTSKRSLLLSALDSAGISYDKSTVTVTNREVFVVVDEKTIELLEGPPAKAHLNQPRFSSGA